MWRNNKRTIIASVAGLVLVVAIAGVSGAFGGGAAVEVPTTAVIKGEFIDYLQVRGEVKAVRSVALTVPTTGGGDLQILELAKNGMNIKKGDVVVRFDPMTVQRTLNDRRSEFKQAEEEIGKTRAQFRIQEQQAQTDLTKARYDVRRAELDAVPSEFLPRMEREQKELALKDAKARLDEAERKLKALGDIEKAELGSKIQKRDKARFDMEHADRQLGGLADPGARGRCCRDHAELALVLSAARFQAGRPRVAGTNHRRGAGSVDAAGDGAARRGGTRPHAARPARDRPRRRRARQRTGREDRRHQRARARRFFQLAAAAQLQHDRRSSIRWIRGCGRA